MHTLEIEWLRLLDEERKTCPRCGSTEREVEKAVQELNRLLADSDVAVSLNKRSIAPGVFRRDALQSNKIVIAGKTLEEWLGATTGRSRCCETCGDSECRTVAYDGDTHEAIPAELIVRAGLTAAAYLLKPTPLRTSPRMPVRKLRRRKVQEEDEEMEIKVLGFGCANCHTMEQMARQAVKELGITAEVVRITDIGEIARHGILSTPGLIVNGKVKHSGKPLPGADKVKELIKDEA